MATGQPRPQALDRLLGQLGVAPPIDLPICVYVADSEGRLVFCNQRARVLLGLPADGDVTAKMTDFYAEADGHERVLESATPPVGEIPAGARSRKTIVHLKVEGRDVYVEHYASSVPSEASEQDGLYVGCMVDVTEDHAASLRTQSLQDTVREMTFDIGQILHANTSMLVMVNQTLQASARAMEPELDADEDACRPEALEVLMGQCASALCASLTRLLEAGDAERRLRRSRPNAGRSSLGS